MSKRHQFSKQLTDAIENAGVSRYRIAKETGIDQALLSRLVNGEAWLGREAMDRLAEYLGLSIEKRKKG